MMVLVCEGEPQRCGFIARILMALPERTAITLCLKVRVVDVESDTKNAIDVTVVRNDADKPCVFYQIFDNIACLTSSSSVKLEEVISMNNTVYNTTLFNVVIRYI
jgi:hypothetical protein